MNYMAEATFTQSEFLQNSKSHQTAKTKTHKDQ